IPVSVAVGTSVFTQLSALTFTKSFGGANPLPQNLNITSTSANFNFTVASSTATGGNWLSVSTTGNCGLCGMPGTVTATVIAGPTLAAGSYTGQIVLTSQSGALSMTVPVYLNVSGSALVPTPTVALRDTSGGIRLGAYASSTLFNAGGVFASDPSAAQDPSGNTFVVARDGSNTVWLNRFISGSQSWAGWLSAGGSIQGVPAMAVDGSGTAWIASRDTFTSYWLLSYTPGGGYGAWLPMGGAFATDPVVAACGDGSIYIVGKDSFNALWSRRYIPGSGFQPYQLGGGVAQGKPSVTCGSDNAIYIVVRDTFSSSWIARVSGNSWTGWFNGGA